MTDARQAEFEATGTSAIMPIGDTSVASTPVSLRRHTPLPTPVASMSAQNRPGTKRGAQTTQFLHEAPGQQKHSKSQHKTESELNMLWMESQIKKNVSEIRRNEVETEVAELKKLKLELEIENLERERDDRADDYFRDWRY